MNENKPFGLSDDDQDDDAEDDGARNNIVGDGGDDAVDLSEHAGGEHRTQQAADAAHHDDQKAIDHHRRSHVGKHGLESGHHHAGDAGEARTEGESQRIDPLDVDAARGGHLPVANDGAHLRADGGAVQDEPR